MAFGDDPRGICKVCGEAARDGRSFYCAEHASMSAYQKRKQGNVIDVDAVQELEPTGAKINVPSKIRKQPTGEDYMGTFGDVIVMGLNMWLLGPLAELSDEEQDRLIPDLAITDEEFETVLSPLFRFFASTSVSKKYGKTIIGYGDMIAVIPTAITILQKVNKINKISKEIKNNGPQPQQTQGSSTTNQPSRGNYPPGFSTVQIFDIS